jgi:hypothetical protein
MIEWQQKNRRKTTRLWPSCVSDQCSVEHAEGMFRVRQWWGRCGVVPAEAAA